MAKLSTDDVIDLHAAAASEVAVPPADLQIAAPGRCLATQRGGTSAPSTAKPNASGRHVGHVDDDDPAWTHKIRDRVPKKIPTRP